MNPARLASRVKWRLSLSNVVCGAARAASDNDGALVGRDPGGGFYYARAGQAYPSSEGRLKFLLDERRDPWDYMSSISYIKRIFLLRSAAPPKKTEKRARLTQRRVPFSAVFLTVAAITVCCVLALVVTALVFPEPTAYQERVFAGLNWGWQVGFGAMLGLLGAKHAR